MEDVLTFGSGYHPGLPLYHVIVAVVVKYFDTAASVQKFNSKQQ